MDDFETVRDGLETAYDELGWQGRGAHDALSRIKTENERLRAALRGLVLQVDTVQRTSVIRESNIYSDVFKVLEGKSE